MTNREIYIAEHKQGNKTLYSVNIYGYSGFNYNTWDKEEAIIKGVNEAKEFLNNIPENTNKLFANIMIRLMEYARKYDYFPNDYYQLLELQREYTLDKIDDEDFDNGVYDLAVRWFKPDSVYKKY